MSEKNTPTDESTDESTGEPEVESPSPLNPDVLRQAIIECRIPSDVTMALFGHLLEIATVYNRLVVEAAVANEKMRTVLGKGVDDETP